MILQKLETVAAALFFVVAGCATTKEAPIAPVSKVDIPRFMGRWFVIACIPTPIETEAYNAIESYKLNKDNEIETTFTFNKGSSDGPIKEYHPKGFVIENTNNAVWGMQFIWPIKSEYIIAQLADDYSTTVIARNSRDYVWIMAHTPTIPESKYKELTSFVKKLGYDLKDLRKIPQKKSN